MFHIMFQDDTFLIVFASTWDEAAKKAAALGDVASIIELEQ